jgi:diguanylate cyclase (GGDEF)-like protein
VVTVISRFRVRNGLEDEVRRAFLNRPRLVEKSAGFCGLNVLTDATDPAIFLLLTRWTDETAFRAWHRSEAHHQSHHLIPEGLKLDSSFTSLTVGNDIDASSILNLTDAFEARPVALSHWLMESDAVFALVLASDGTICLRNRASHRIFPTDPAKNSGSCIWDYVVCSEGRLRERLSDATDQLDDCVLLNLADGQKNSITLDVGMIRFGEAILLLGTHERRHDSNFQTEIVALTNDLSVTMREIAQKNRELEKANEIIERLARTDSLTGLANRRTLDEVLGTEIARAARLGKGLSLVIADLDHFKSINDEFGHITGDHVLAGAAAVLGSQLRPYDLAARYGGEEFVLLLPGTSTEDAVALAERVRQEIAKITVASCPKQITISLGVASWRTGEASEQFVARADGALYNAKMNGRNRVEAASSIRV